MLTELERLDHVRVLDARRQSGLVEKRRQLFTSLRLQPFDGDEPVEAVRAAQPADVDGAHAAAGELAEQLIATQLETDLGVGCGIGGRLRRRVVTGAVGRRVRLALADGLAAPQRAPRPIPPVARAPRHASIVGGRPPSSHRTARHL